MSDRSSQGLSTSDTRINANKTVQPSASENSIETNVAPSAIHLRKYLRSDEIDQSPQPLQDLVLLADSLSSETSHSFVIRIYVSSSGAVDDFVILSSTLSSEEISLVFRNFKETSFSPGMSAGVAVASEINLEIGIEPFMSLSPRIPSLQPTEHK